MQRTGVTRPGGRTARTQQAVHRAVRGIVEAGTPRPSIGAVAAASGVNAATIYRRWGSIDSLLLEIAVEDVNLRAPVEVTGDLRTDLLSYGQQLRRAVMRPGGLAFLHAIVASAAADGTASTLDVLQARLHQFDVMLDAADRRTALGVIDLIDLLLAPIYLRGLLSQPPILSEDDLERLVDNLLAVDATRIQAGTERPRFP